MGDDQKSVHTGLLTGARHEFEVLPDQVDLAAQRDNPEGKVDLAGWHYEVEGHGWVYTGTLDDKGAASVRVVKANAAYDGRIHPPGLQRRLAQVAHAIGVADDLEDPGQGLASRRRARLVNEIVGTLP